MEKSFFFRPRKRRWLQLESVNEEIIGSRDDVRRGSFLSSFPIARLSMKRGPLSAGYCSCVVGVVEIILVESELSLEARVRPNFVSSHLGVHVGVGVRHAVPVHQVGYDYSRRSRNAHGTMHQHSFASKSSVFNELNTFIEMLAHVIL